MKLLNAQAKIKSRMGNEWEPYEWQLLPTGGPYEVASVTGAVAPLITRGNRKGQRNWRKMDKTTVRTVYITTSENDAFVANWQQETGLCANCVGGGKIMQSCHHATGTIYQDCRDCNGTGKFARK